MSTEPTLPVTATASRSWTGTAGPCVAGLCLHPRNTAHRNTKPGAGQNIKQSTQKGVQNVRAGVMRTGK